MEDQLVSGADSKPNLGMLSSIPNRLFASDSNDPFLEQKRGLSQEPMFQLFKLS